MDNGIETKGNDLDEKKLIAENLSCYKEASSQWSENLILREKAYRFYLGDPWDAKDKAKHVEEGRALLSLNIVKKQVDLLTGMNRQSGVLPKLFPVEETDAELSEMYSALIKWVFTHCGNDYYIPFVGDDQVKGGLGFFRVEMDFSRDRADGDILIRQANPFSVLFDPNASKPDLSDCKYIVTNTWLNKTELLSMYPDKKDVIDALEEKDPKGDGEVQASIYSGKKINVKERWYRKTESVEEVFVPGENGEEDSTIEWPEAEDSEERFVVFKQQHPGAVKNKRDVTKVKVCITANDEILLVDADHPDGIADFPIIPVFGWYTPSYNDWEYKLQGVPHILMDLQDEKNHLHSQMTNAVKTLPISGFWYEKGAIDNPKDINNIEGGTKLIPVNKMDGIRQIQPPQLSTALTELFSLVSGETNNIGLNPDLIGQQQSKSEAGINIQLRQKQGMATIQDFPANMSMAKKIVTEYILKLINKNWSREKIEKILGRQLPEDWEMRKDEIIFDVVVNEVTDSPSYRMANLSALVDLQQRGVQVDPELIIEYLDVPEDMKLRLKGPIRQQRALTDEQMKVQMLTLQLQQIQISMQIQQLQNPPAPQPVQEPVEQMEQPMEEQIQASAPVSEPGLMESEPEIDPNTGLPMDADITQQGI